MSELIPVYVRDIVALFYHIFDSAIGEGYVYNMFPDSYFRFSTDSYNDAIAKAFPELFEARHQDVIGTGADGDVFVHNPYMSGTS